MTIINSHQLQPSDLRRLGHALPAIVRSDRDEMRSAVNRSLALHGEALAEFEAADFERSDRGAGTSAPAA